jgi:hypothetical protein
MVLLKSEQDGRTASPAVSFRAPAPDNCGEGFVHAIGTDAHSLAPVVKFVPKGLHQARRAQGEKRLLAIAQGAGLRLANPGGTDTWN